MKGNRFRIHAILAISFFLLILGSSMAPVRGEGGQKWITSYTISNSGTSQVYQKVNFQTGMNNTLTQAILVGDELNVTFTVSVSTSAPYASLQVSTTMDHSAIESTYWQLQSNYAGINAQSYNPNQQSVSFNQTAGTLVMSCYGKIPISATQTQISGITLHKTAQPILIKLTGPDGAVLDQIVVNVIDSKISQYQTAYNNALTQYHNFQTLGVDPAYLTLYKNVLDGAQTVSNQGLVDNAIITLTQLSASNPASIKTPIEATLFIPAVIGLAVVVVIVAFLFVRARGKSSYYSLVIEDQIKDLEGLTMRAARVDKTIASSLDGIKERLQQLVGA